MCILNIPRKQSSPSKEGLLRVRTDRRLSGERPGTRLQLDVYPRKFRKSHRR